MRGRLSGRAATGRGLAADVGASSSTLGIMDTGIAAMTYISYFFTAYMMIIFIIRILNKWRDRQKLINEGGADEIGQYDVMR